MIKIDVWNLDTDEMEELYMDEDEYNAMIEYETREEFERNERCERLRREEYESLRYSRDD